MAYTDIKTSRDLALRNLGYTGEFGAGGGDAYLQANNITNDQLVAKIKSLGYQTGAEQVPAATPVPITSYTANQVQNPTLPAGTNLVPITQQVQQNELQTAPPPVQAQTVATPPTVTTPTVQTQQGQAQTVDPNQAASLVNPNAGTYQATTIGNNAAQGTAAQGQVNEQATVQGQLKKLYSEAQVGMVPDWAKGAVELAENVLAARGLGASSLGANAIAAAVQQSALPIAAQDAQTYFQMDMQNLSNSQQMAMANLQNKQQALLSDQSAMNASAQFNASSTAQTQQFMASLVASIQTQNADRITSMSQFNAGEANKASQFSAQLETNVQEFNSQQKSAIDTFNAQLAFQRDTFNAQMQFAIDQSNVLWRRSVNTANTAAVNAANQTNVQNMYNLSQTAMNNIWQQFRDEASWTFTASENDKTRAYNTAMAANNRQFASDQQGNGFAQAAGAFAAGLFR